MRGKVSPPIIRAHAYIVSSHFEFFVSSHLRITLAEVEHKTTQCHWIDGEEADLSVLVNGTSSKHVIASESDSDAGEGSSFVSFGVRSLYKAVVPGAIYCTARRTDVRGYKYVPSAAIV